MNTKSNRNQRIGWQGVGITLPEDWSFAGFQGNRKEGLLRVDSAGSIIAELRWMPSRKKDNLARRVDAYLTDVEKLAKKKKEKFTARIEPIDGNGILAYRYIADRTVYGFGKICPDCGRVIIGQVVGRHQDPVQSVYKDLVNRITDHSDDGWDVWGLMGVQFSVPKKLLLDKPKMMSGYLKMPFKKFAEEVIVEKWGLADVSLKRWSVREWVNQFADWKGYKQVTTEDRLINGHQAYIGQFRSKPGSTLARDVLFALLKYPMVHRFAAWHCPESNAIISVRCFRSQPEQFEALLSRVECH